MQSSIRLLSLSIAVCWVSSCADASPEAIADLGTRTSPEIQSSLQKANPELDSRLDRLYRTVSAKFVNNAWFHNSADADLGRLNARAAAVPEFKMMDRMLFRNVMKSYCVLLESPHAKEIKNPGRYGIINFSQHASERRFYLYDVARQEITDNLWTTHGSNSRVAVYYTLKDTGAEELQRYTKAEVLSYNDSAQATLFSNRNGSLQSSVGMAIAETQTYYSDENEWTALRMSGVDGELNNKIRARAVVLHEYGYNGQSMRYYGEPPLSEGCPMLPRSGFYKGQSDVEIAKTMLHALYGAPVFFYHDRMQASVNESAHRAQLELLKKLRGDIATNLNEYQDDYEWDAATQKKLETALTSKLNSTFSPLIEETYQYFKNRSAYYGVEPKSATDCMKALGI